MQSIDESIVNNNGVRYVYILLPYFTRSLQDILVENVLNGTKMEEVEILKIFIGVCRGLKIMHNYKQVARNRLDDGDEEEALLQDEEDVEPVSTATEATEMNELVPYAHHDIKPANVMISAEGLPVLVDLGSCSRARYNIKTRQQALALTSFAQEHCTLPYRAPELLDVATGSQITESTDIWSLGCLLYSCCFGYSPFEKLEIEQGANLHVAIGSGRYQIPKGNNGYSKELIGMIKKCLKVNASERPTADELLDAALDISGKLSV
ncbi:ENV7 [Candida metapsilosis]|uniref:non-specific serine/threonine protein kinase n=1 Tax=Candida metapsilosis TaxID=273372 RepID=A0A8H7ZGD7_9ASCO|nr:ENV7 [Candida metapsilosis]